MTNISWWWHLVKKLGHLVEFGIVTPLAGFCLVRSHDHQPFHTAHIKTHRKRILQLIASSGKKERSDSDKYWWISTHGRFVFFMPVFDLRWQVWNRTMTSPTSETTCGFRWQAVEHTYGEAICTHTSTRWPSVDTFMVTFHHCSLTVHSTFRPWHQQTNVTIEVTCWEWSPMHVDWCKVSTMVIAQRVMVLHVFVIYFGQ